MKQILYSHGHKEFFLKQAHSHEFSRFLTKDVFRFYISYIMARTSLTPDKLLELIDPKNPTLLKEMGGASGLALSLNSDLEKV